MKIKRLSPRHLNFVDAYISFGDGTRAAIVAGFSPVSASTQAGKLLAMPAIQAQLQKRQKEVAQALNITPEKVLAEVARLAFSSPGDIYATLKDNGYDLHFLTTDQRAALTSFSEETYTEGRGLKAQRVKKQKVTVADKKGALELLMRNLGMLADRTHVDLSDRLEDMLRAGRRRIGEVVDVTPTDAGAGAVAALRAGARRVGHAK